MEFLKKNLVVFLSSLLFFIWTVAAFFPGEMSPDTLEQYKQVLSGIYNDQQPPIMAALWRFLIQFGDQPGVLFLFHNLFYWAFWSLLASVFFKDWKVKLAVLAIAAIPPCWSQVIVVWKDTEFSIGLLGAYLFQTLAKRVENDPRRDERRKYYFFISIAVLLFIYSAAIRLNSWPTLLPLAWYMFSSKDRKFLSLRTFSFVSLLLLFSFITVQWIDYGLLKANKTHIFQEIEAHDIAGIFVDRGDEGLLPDHWKKNVPLGLDQTLRKAYDPQQLDTLVWAGPVRSTTDPDQLKELHHKWLEDIRSFPFSYLHHRWEVFQNFLGMGKPEIFYPFQTFMAPNPYGLKEMGDRELRVPLKLYFWTFRDSFLFKGFFYLLLSIGILLFHFSSTSPPVNLKGPSFFAAASAVLNALGYFFYAPDYEFRYLYPTVTLSLFSMLILMATWKDIRVQKRKVLEHKRPKRPSKRFP